MRSATLSQGVEFKALALAHEHVRLDTHNARCRWWHRGSTGLVQVSCEEQSHSRHWDGLRTSHAGTGSRVQVLP